MTPSFRQRAATLVGVPVLVASLLSGSASGSASGRAAATDGSYGAGDGYFPADGNGGYDVLHYDVRDTMRMDTGRLTGVTTVRARAGQTLTSLSLDLLLQVDSVSVDGVRAAYVKPTRHELRVRPATPIAAGQVFRVRVAYRGRPQDIAWNGERSWFGDAREVLAVNQPHIAPWWFPANDHPSDKAAFDISVRVPRGLTVVSNGRLVERRTGTSWTTFHWRATEPMATYLAFFAAGRFTVRRGTTASGVPYTLAVSRRLDPIERELAWQLMGRTPAVQAWLEGHLGRYPFGSTGGLTTWHDTGFALENQTRSVYPFLGGSGSDDIVAHELAHQWFGDSVTLRRWRDIWLNEGLATYMEQWWLRRGPTSTAQLCGWLRATYAGGDLDWSLPIGDPGPNRLFRNEVYVRGALTAQALRNVIGDAAFRTLLRRWVTEHRHGHAATADFRALAEEVSGISDLGGFFDAWLGAGKPANTAANGLGRLTTGAACA